MSRCIWALVCLFACVSATAQTSVFVNELHYDNASTDQNEAVEVAGAANTDLSGWSLVLYNGAGGASYATLPLSGFIPDLCGGYGAVNVPATGLQNGSPDGVALVNGSGTVVQFLSYEGVFAATNGPASGMTSIDIGVSEDGTGPATSSLALTGTGSTYQDFTWGVAASSSFGACNTGQTFTGGVDNVPSVQSTTPIDGATAVGISSNVTLTFSEPVTVSGAWFEIVCSMSGVRPVSEAVVSGSSRVLTINPNDDFTNSEQCAVTIFAAQVVDQDGAPNNLDADYTFGFTLAADIPPTVVAVTPGPGSTNVWTGVNVGVTFSEDVTAPTGAFGLTCASVAQPFVLSGGPRAYTLNPTAELPGSALCTVAVTASQIVDVDGTPNAMQADFSSSFTTGLTTADYYASADSSSASVLRTSLHAIIRNHTRFPYTATTTDTWDILELADEDPLDPTRVLDIYKNASYPKAGGGNTNYNREHSWPKSYGFPDDTSSNWPYTDTHHLVISDSGYNSARSNRYFDTCATGCTEYPTGSHNGQGGGSGVYPGNSNWGAGSRWEVWHARKGDLARAVMYMDVRYEGGMNSLGAAEPDLVLTDIAALIAVSGGNTAGTAYMGLLSVLIEWSEQDPPDEREVMRNSLVQSFQGNRNPFVDHPEWVACIFLGQCIAGDLVFSDGFE